jgi:hypothetical protein
MTLTELYYYYGNHPSPKVGSLPAFSLSPTTEGCALPELAADELIDGLEAALRRVTALHAHASPPLVDLARRSLAALTRARIAGRLANVIEQFAREFRLNCGDLQSRSREQHAAFAGSAGQCSQPRRRQREVRHDQSYVAQRDARGRGVVASPRPLAARRRNRPWPCNLSHQVYRYG